MHVKIFSLWTKINAFVTGYCNGVSLMSDGLFNGALSCCLAQVECLERQPLSCERICAVSSSSNLSAEDVFSCCHMLMKKGKDDGEVVMFVFSKETLGCAERCQGKNRGPWILKWIDHSQNTCKIILKSQYYIIYPIIYSKID